MQEVNPGVEIEKIKALLSNFSWHLVTQAITEKAITLTIQKHLTKNDFDLELDEG